MDVPNEDDVFQRFAELLEDRFSKGRITTEDSVRYTLFHCLTEDWNIDPSDIILEYPHPRISGAEVDTYVIPRNGQPGIAFEFKFDRKIPSGSNLPRPQKAGKIFADIFRLALFKAENNVQLFFVYVTDDEMAAYLQNPSNQLADFFNIMLQQRLVIDNQYIKKHSATLVNAVGSSVTDCEVICRLKREFRSDFWLRIYEVKPTTAGGGGCILRKDLPENGMIAIGVVLIFLGLVNRMADLAAFFFGSSLTLFYFFTKIPSALDRYFRTKAFRLDLALRFSFVVFPLVMFLTFFMYYPFAYLFLPEPLQIVRVSYGFEIAIMANVALIFAFITFYSWRLWRYPDAALRLWRKVSGSQREFELDFQQSQTGGNLSALNRFICPGVAPMAIAVLLFLALLILRIFDVLLIGFLLLWLGHNVLHELGQRQSEFLRTLTPAIRFFRFFDQTVTWEGILRTGLRGNVSGIWDTFVLFMCFILLIIPSVSSLAGFIVMFGFLGSWYLVIVLVQIMRRLGTVVNKAETKSNQLHVLPPHKDLALTGILSLIAIFSLLMTYPLLEAKTRLGVLIIASLVVNAINFFSIWRWARERERPKRRTKGVYGNRDRYRMDAIFLFSGLPIALIVSGAKGLLFWMMFSGAVILLSLSDRMLSKTSKSTPRTCASYRVLYITLIVCLIFGSAMWFFPESRLTLEILAPLMGFLIAVMGILFYKGRKYSLKTAQTHAN